MYIQLCRFFYLRRTWENYIKNFVNWRLNPFSLFKKKKKKNILSDAIIKHKWCRCCSIFDRAIPLIKTFANDYCVVENVLNFAQLVKNRNWNVFLLSSLESWNRKRLVPLVSFVLFSPTHGNIIHWRAIHFQCFLSSPRVCRRSNCLSSYLSTRRTE